MKKVSTTMTDDNDENLAIKLDVGKAHDCFIASRIIDIIPHARKIGEPDMVTIKTPDQEFVTAFDFLRSRRKNSLYGPVIIHAKGNQIISIQRISFRAVN